MLLSIVTRCYKRPIGLRRNQLSLILQTCQDYEQILLVDDVGIGLEAAADRLATDAPALIKGDYVYVLDDDDLLIDNGFVAKLQYIASFFSPDIIMVKSDDGTIGILPTLDVWEKKPIYCQVGGQNYVVKADVWKRHASAFISERDIGDFAFIEELFRHDYTVYWLDAIMAMMGPIAGQGFGRPE